MSLMQNCLLFLMVGLESEIFAFIAENFTVEVLLQNLWTTLYMPYCRNRFTITEMRADCLYLAGKRCITALLGAAVSMNLYSIHLHQLQCQW